MTRVVQHNIRVASKYYKQIRCSRLATLLGLDEDATERAVSAMVSITMIIL
jgi:PCI domain